MARPDFALSCPIPISGLPARPPGPRRRRPADASSSSPALFRRRLRQPPPRRGHDGALLPPGRGPPGLHHRLLRGPSPLFFPGGDIGTLAVTAPSTTSPCAAPGRCCSAPAFILEEGLEMETLWRIVRSMGRPPRPKPGCASSPATPRWSSAARATACSSTPPASACVRARARSTPPRSRPATRCCSAATSAGTAWPSWPAREGLAFESAIESDSALVAAPVLALLEAGIDVHCLRDLTRGGLASALIEIAELAQPWPSTSTRARSRCATTCAAPARSSASIPSTSPTRVASSPSSRPETPPARPGDPRRARGQRRATLIGEVAASPAGQLALRTAFGPERIVDMLSGEQLPRIC